MGFDRAANVVTIDLAERSEKGRRLYMAAPFGHKNSSLRMRTLRLPGTFAWLATRRSMSRSGSSRR